MHQFEQYLKAKLKDKKFNDDYRDNCNVCSVVWQIVKVIEEQNIDLKLLADKTGISTDDLQSFIDADNCQHHIITTLCSYFNIDLPLTCQRFDFNKK